MAWAFIILFYAAPLAHVAFSRHSGSWRPAAGARCPFGQRAAWVIMVVLTGAIGWLMYMNARRRITANQESRRGSQGMRPTGTPSSLNSRASSSEDSP